LIKDMLEDQEESAAEDIKIHIPNVDGRTLRYVIEYIEYHHNHPANPIEKPLKAPIDQIISEWDKKFIFTDLVKGGDETQHSLLIQVIMAANFVNVRDLLDLTCATVASMLRNKTPEQIRNLFQIENDFSPEEEARIREENRWVEETP